jgi:hypothetical protein
MARPILKLDVARIEALAAIGCPYDEIAADLNCAERTIKSRYCTVVKKGHLKCRQRVRSILFKQAMEGNGAAAIFLAKAICGMREPRDESFLISQNNLAITISVGEVKQIEAIAEPVRQSVKQMFSHYKPGQLGTVEGNGNRKEDE